MSTYPQRVADNILPLSLAGILPDAFTEWYFTENIEDHEVANKRGQIYFIEDLTLCLSKMFVPGVGMAGRSGFNELNNGKMVNKYFGGGHSLYFETKGVISDLFMKTYWVECFMGKSLPKAIDQRITKIYTPFIEFIMGVMDFIKNILFYGAIVYVLYMFFD